MVNHEEPRDERSESEDEVFTGDPVESLFDVETSGEAGDDEGTEASEHGHGDPVEFAVDALLGEELPPELSPPSQTPPEADPFELDLLDPTDPGISSEDLIGFEEEENLPRGPVEDADQGGEEDRSAGHTDDRYAWLYDEAAEPPPAVAERYGTLASDEPDATDNDAGGQPEVDDERPVVSDEERSGAGSPGPLDDPDLEMAEPRRDAASDEDGDSVEPAIPSAEVLFPDAEEDVGAREDDQDLPSDEDGDTDSDDSESDSDDGDIPPDWEGFTGEHYVAHSTTEYEGLAEELIRPKPPSEQMAVAAGIPGLETSIVGLDDVVGEERADAVAADEGPDLGIRIVTGIGLLALFATSLLWSPAVAILATVVFVLAASEMYAVLIANGQRPVAVFGLVGVAGCLLGTWIWGLVAVPVSLVATLVAVALFFATSTPRPSPLPDAALTALVVVWIGGLGAFALPIITAPDYRWLIAGVVVLVAVLDIGQYFVGRRLGSRPLAPTVSPNKTVEGLIGGAVATLVVAVLLGLLWPFSLASALLLAIGAIVLGPLGDLSVSLVKRILRVKDMGTVLPGHGGILDRIDALLFVLPAAWVVYRAAELLA